MCGVCGFRGERWRCGNTESVTTPVDQGKSEIKTKKINIKTEIGMENRITEEEKEEKRRKEIH